MLCFLENIGNQLVFEQVIGIWLKQEWETRFCLTIFSVFFLSLVHYGTLGFRKKCTAKWGNYKTSGVIFVIYRRLSKLSNEFCKANFWIVRIMTLGLLSWIHYTWTPGNVNGLFAARVMQKSWNILFCLSVTICQIKMDGRRGKIGTDWLFLKFIIFLSFQAYFAWRPFSAVVQLRTPNCQLRFISKPMVVFSTTFVLAKIQLFRLSTLTMFSNSNRSSRTFATSFGFFSALQNERKELN